MASISAGSAGGQDVTLSTKGVDPNADIEVLFKDGISYEERCQVVSKSYTSVEIITPAISDPSYLESSFYFEIRQKGQVYECNGCMFTIQSAMTPQITGVTTSTPDAALPGTFTVQISSSVNLDLDPTLTFKLQLNDATQYLTIDSTSQGTLTAGAIEVNFEEVPAGSYTLKAHVYGY